MKGYLFLLPVIALMYSNICLGQDLNTLGAQKPFEFNGGLELRGIFYNANGIPDRRQPFTYLLSGSPTLNLYGWSIPTSFTVSKEQNSFQQPFNQYGISPTYKWVTLHAGHRSVNFSPYTLAGHTMLGAGFELKPGKIRVGFMYGRLNKATVIDTATMALVPFSFSRKGYAGRLGYGSSSNYFDLSFLHAKDDSTSIAALNLADSTRVTAASNSVLGYGTKFTLFKRFSFESDGALSVYTRDINSPIQFDTIKDPTLDKLKGLLNINGSTELFLAFSAGVGYAAKNYGVKVNYRRVEPDFKSMGAYFFSNDVENLTVSPNFSLREGKLRFNGSFGIERDNVRLQKTSTTKRIIANGNLSAEITERFGLDAFYSNFSNNQKPNTLRFADSLKIVQVTQNLSLMPRYMIVGGEVTHMIMAAVNMNNLNDYNSYFGADAVSRNITTQQYMLNYNISFPKKFLSLFGSLNYSKMGGMGIETSYSGITLGGSYILFNKKLNTGLSCSVLNGKTGESNSLIINSSANLNYKIDKRQSLRSSFFWTKNNPGSIVSGGYPGFRESRGEIAYQINFGL